MYLELTEEQKLIQETARDFAKNELEPVAAALDQSDDRTPLMVNLKKLAELGFMGLNVKEQYGGTEAGVIAFSLAIGLPCYLGFGYKSSTGICYGGDLAALFSGLRLGLGYGLILGVPVYLWKAPARK